jgi:hypothetical protein
VIDQARMRWNSYSIKKKISLANACSCIFDDPIECPESAKDSQRIDGMTVIMNSTCLLQILMTTRKFWSSDCKAGDPMVPCSGPKLVSKLTSCLLDTNRENFPYSPKRIPMDKTF